MKYVLVALLLSLSGCKAALHVFDEGVEHPVHSPWARAEAARLAPIYGTDPNLETRFLDIGPQGGLSGWADGFRITVCLNDNEGIPRPACNIHNIWHHEFWHFKEGGIRLDDHYQEYMDKLIAEGLWEFCP